MAVNGINGPGGPNRPDNLGQPEQGQRRAGQTRDGGSDRVDLSPEARSFAALSEAAAALPDVRQDRVDALRNAVEAGTYRVDARQVADAILEFEDGLRP